MMLCNPLEAKRVASEMFIDINKLAFEKLDVNLRQFNANNLIELGQNSYCE